MGKRGTDKSVSGVWRTKGNGLGGGREGGGPGDAQSNADKKQGHKSDIGQERRDWITIAMLSVTIRGSEEIASDPSSLAPADQGRCLRQHDEAQGPVDWSHEHACKHELTLFAKCKNE